MAAHGPRLWLDQIDPDRKDTRGGGRLNDEEFHLLDEIEESHWWFVGKRILLRSLLADIAPGGRMLDLGCGTGGILRDWMGTHRCVGVDRSALALQICSRRGFDVLARADLNHMPFGDDRFDAVLLVDVIEHLEDDVGFLDQAKRLVAPGGRMIVSAPAFQLLWSQHDVTFEHHRRYSVSQLVDVVRRAGLEPERTTCTNFILFPVAVLWRVLSYRLGVGRFAPKHDFWPIPGWLNAFLAGLYRLEAWCLRRADVPFGVSVVCIARRP
jgi:SAM-dependent methyltransferase